MVCGNSRCMEIAMDKCFKRLHFHGAIFFLCLFILGIYTSYSNSISGIKFLLSIEAAYKNVEKNKNWEMSDGMRGGGRRLLGGPGSSPPRCTYKCGGCTPCKPVHVVVPPGTRVTTEYYPEAWRCKCGNKLYMP
ncbi:hypothetical protein ACS0TY_008051 [Phlomoides rotata]